jgi:Ohr subfamily peroxiredoxin
MDAKADPQVPTTGRLQVSLSVPGTPGTGTNPEQLFAIGWSACFLSAAKLVAGRKKTAVPSDTAIDAEVDLGLVHGLYHLAARLNVSLSQMDEETVQSLVEIASHVCPSALATKGNIDVTYATTSAGRLSAVQHA